MDTNLAIGKVITRIFRDKLADLQEGNGAKFYFQGIGHESVAEAVKLIAADSVLSGKTEIHLPRSQFESFGLPDELLTENAVGDYRNDELDDGKKIMLLGYPDVSEWDTIRLMKAFGEEQLMDAAKAWVDEFAPDHMPEQVRTWWIASLRGLNSLAFARLPEFASFVSRTSACLYRGDKLLQEALGESLPTLNLPRHTNLFGINEKLRGHTSQWKAKYNDHKRNTQCFLSKKDKNEGLIDNDALAQAISDYRGQSDHDPATAAIFDEYLAADHGHTPTSAKIAEIEWTTLNSALFERVAPKKNLNLAADTEHLFNSEQHLRDLDEGDRDYLAQLKESGTKGDAGPADRSFFRKFYRELQTNPSLFTRWEAFILEKSVEDSDFLKGLARCMRILRPRVDGTAWKLVVRAKASQPKDLYQVNESAGTYFSTRYRGLPAILADSVKFAGIDPLFNYPEDLAKWRKDPAIKKKLKGNKPGKTGCQLVFYVESTADSRRQIKLTWVFKPSSISTNLRDDMTRVAGATHVAICTEVMRETSGRRAVPLDLETMLGLQPAFGREAGSLVPSSEKLPKVASRVRIAAILDSFVSSQQVSSDQKDEILSAFDLFEKSYHAALHAFLDKGLWAHSEVLASANAFGVSLKVASQNILTDTVQGTLLPAILSTSIVQVLSSGSEARTAAIVPPWHPLRLLAITSKAIQFADLFKELTSGSGTMSDADGDLLFEDTAEWLDHIYYPEVVCVLRGRQGEVLSDCEHFQEYSVHEPPVKDSNSEAPTDSDPAAAAAQIGALVTSYVQLQPHERDNLSIVLFDCDSEVLPAAVVEEIRDLSEDEDQDSMCQILLAHSDKGKLRALYRSLSRSSESGDSFNSSEATREFMARLRINIMVADHDTSRPQDGQPYDIVFSEGTISRHAKLLWESIVIDARPAETVKPSAWSRRKAMRSGSVSSAVFLTSPTAPDAVWDYLNSIAHAIEPEKARHTSAGFCLAPCRSLGIHEDRVGHLIDRMHSLGTWVVNYDELLHRKLLENRGIRIIRYKQDATQGKNLIISSKAKDGLLRTELRRITQQLLPTLDEATHNRLGEQLINEANSISGNLVLRAIRRSENAKELLGLVLSKYLVSQELGHDRLFGWFLLDDYAAWLGEDEKQIADILCLSPSFDKNGRPVLDIVVTEAKFVEHTSKKAKESANQLKQSLARLERGLSSKTKSLDRRIWLARISDMIVDGLEVPAIDPFDAVEWRRKVRDGECDIRIRGYSHVFDHSSQSYAPTSEAVQIKETDNGFQEIFSRVRLCNFLTAFMTKGTPDREAPEAIADKAKPPKPPAPSTPFAEAEMPVTNIPAPEDTTVASPEPTQDAAPAPVSSIESTSEPEPAGDAPHALSISDILNGTRVPVAADGSTSQGPVEVTSDEMNAWVTKTTVDCRRALTSYQMESEVVGTPVLTPNSLIIRFRGTDKVTPASIEKKRTEILTTHGLEVLSIRPEAGAVAIAIRRPQRQTVTTADVWNRWLPERSAKGNIKAVIAVQEHDNGLLHLSPYPQPHTLVSGGTGSGKSVLLQNLMLGLAVTNTPAQMQFVIIDPKQSAQIAPFCRLPHMRCPIVVEPDQAIQTLKGLTAEMDVRNKVLADADCADIDEYIDAGHTGMPRIWVIYDEFGDWITDSDFKAEAMPLLDRLAMKARSSGIYLVLAAQRPDNTLFSMVLRANLGNRLALQVADAGTSEVATGVKNLGAERLLGRGHLLALAGHLSGPVYAQVPLISSADVRGIVNHIVRLYAPSEATVVPS